MIFTVDHLWKNNFLNIRESFEDALERKALRFYIAIETNVIPTEAGTDLTNCIKTLQLISQSSFTCLILYTNDPYPYEWVEWGQKCGIKFEHINQNPEIISENYQVKPYYDLLFDKKAGFNIHDWEKVLALLNRGIDRFFHRDIPIAKPVSNPPEVTPRLSMKIDGRNYSSDYTRTTSSINSVPIKPVTTSRIRRTASPTSKFRK